MQVNSICLEEHRSRCSLTCACPRKLKNQSPGVVWCHVTHLTPAVTNFLFSNLNNEKRNKHATKKIITVHPVHLY